MATCRPGQEGPSYAPPQLPEGWIPQWDANSKKYYFVQLSTGASQWETPTQYVCFHFHDIPVDSLSESFKSWQILSAKAMYRGNREKRRGKDDADIENSPAPTGPTPQATPQGVDHPYGTPGSEEAGTRGIDGPDGDRSLGGDLGKMAMNQFLGGGKKTNNSNSSPLASLAGSFLGGGSNSGHQGSSSSSGAGGIAGALMGSLLGGGGKKPEHNQGSQPNYSGSHSNQQQGGFMGNLGGMFGGHQQGGSVSDG